jgi:hypothetical protein
LLGFASFSGNRRYISTGNALLFLIDCGSRTRLKIWAHAEVSEDLLFGREIEQLITPRAMSKLHAIAWLAFPATQSKQPQELLAPHSTIRSESP